MRLPHCLLGHRALQGASAELSGALAACPPPPGVDYTLNGAPLRVEAGRNLTIVGAGDGATITRGQTSGRLIEVLSARLELRNVHLEGGIAQVRHCCTARGAVCEGSARLRRRPNSGQVARNDAVRLRCRRAAASW